MIPSGLAEVLRLALDPPELFRTVFDARTLRALWKAIRPFSLVIAGFSCILGAVLAFRDGSRDWLNAAAALLAGLCLQSGVNLINDFFEFKQRRPEADRAEPPPAADHHPAFGGERDRQEWLIFCAGLAVMASAAPIGLLIAIRTGWPILILGMIGLAGGYGYNGEPLNYKRRGLGVPFVFFLIGVFMIAGTYYAVRGAFSWSAVLASLPLSFLVSLILLANEIRDEQTDRLQGIRTLTGRIGCRWALSVYFLLLAAAYGGAALLYVFGLVPHLRFLFFALPFAIPPTAIAFRKPALRTPIIPFIMLHHAVFGGLYTLTFLFP